MEPGQRPAPLRQTKLHSPPARAEFIRRPHRIGRMNDGRRRTPGVRLRSAPAGFSKTEPLSENDKQALPSSTPQPYPSIYPFIPYRKYTTCAVNKRPARPPGVDCRAPPRPPAAGSLVT
jgi:hypothetical protein